MRLGCCAGLEQAETVRNSGYDFIEVNVQSVLQGEVSDSQWWRHTPDPDTLAVPVEAANSLVPGSLPIVGPHRDLAALQHYMDRVAERARRMGMWRLVFGSGGARKRPEGVSEAEARSHLLEFVKLAGDACGERDIVLVIEHLNRGETNTINDLQTALELCDEVDHPAVSVLVDSYHYGLEQESDEDLLNLGDRLMHAHVAEPVDRLPPGAHGESEKAFDFVHFFHLMRKISYDQRVAVEAKWPGELAELAPAAAEVLRAAWDAAGCAEG